MSSLQSQILENVFNTILIAFLILSIAVVREDPLMTYYPKLKSLLYLISGSEYKQVKLEFYQLLLNNFYSSDKVKYIKNEYIKSELMLMILSDTIHQFLHKSLSLEDTLFSMLEIVKGFQSKCKQSLLSPYCNILFALTYHPANRISSLARVIMSRLSKKSQLKTMIIQLFSSDQQARQVVSKQLFGENIEQQSLKPISKNQKLLKIPQSSIVNYINIVMNQKLAGQTRNTAIIQLIDSIQRAQLNSTLIIKLQQLQQTISKIVSKNVQCSSFIDLYCVLQQRLNLTKKQSDETLLNWFIVNNKQLRSRTKQRILSFLFVSCFQSPFTSQKQKSWVMKYFPHIQMAEMDNDMPEVPHDYHQISLQSKQIKAKDNTLKNVKDFKQYTQKYIKGKYQTLDMDLIENQIVSGLDKADGLSLVAYLLPTFKVDIAPFVSIILNHICTHNRLNCGFLDDAIAIIKMNKIKRTKQVQTFIQNKLSKQPYYALKAMNELQTLNVKEIETLIKVMKQFQSDQLIFAFQIIRKYLINSKFNQLDEYSQMLLFSILTKQIKSNNLKVAQHSLYFLTQIVQQCQSSSVVLNAVTSLVMEDAVDQNLFVLGIQCVNQIVDKTQQHSQLLQVLLSKCVMLLKQTQRISLLVVSAIYSYFSCLLQNNLNKIIEGIDIIDYSVSLLKLQSQSSQQLIMIANVCQFLYEWRKVQPQINQYFIGSTSLLQNIFTITKLIKNNKNDYIYIENVLQYIGLLLNYLSSKDDYFVFKINKLYSDNPALIQQGSIFKHLGQLCPKGTESYLKMYSWLVIVEWKGRSIFDIDNYGYDLVRCFIDKGCLNYTTSLIAISNSAKCGLVQSSQFLQSIKRMCNLLDVKVVKDIKSKKCNKQQPEPQQITQILQVLKLLSSLFHQSNTEDKTLELSKQLSRKLMLLVQKLYAFNSMTKNNVQLQKAFLKMITNLCQSDQFSFIFSNHISQGSSAMLNDACNSILKHQSFSNQIMKVNFKKALNLLSVLSAHQTVRSIILRMKIIQDLNQRVAKLMDDKKDNILQVLYDIIGFYVSISQYKTTNAKLINDKKILQLLIDIICQQKFILLQQKILQLIQNVSCFKQNKSIFLNNKQIHKMLLWLLGENVPYKDTVILIIYNIVFKSAAAIKIYRKKQIMQQIQSVPFKDAKQAHKALLEALTETN